MSIPDHARANFQTLLWLANATREARIAWWRAVKAAA